jgi:signal peptidase I
MIYFYSGYFKYYAIAIASGSMNPQIKKGDIVVVNQRISNPEIGDVIAYRRDSVIVVHRIVKKINISDSYLYYTKR